MTLRPLLVGRSPAWALLRAAVLGLGLVAVSRVALSMLPTHANGEFLLLNRLAYRTAPPQRGDVVAVGDHAVLVKRVVEAVEAERLLRRPGVEGGR